jgi:hypothetical protein
MEQASGQSWGHAAWTMCRPDPRTTIARFTFPVVTLDFAPLTSLSDRTGSHGGCNRGNSVEARQ